MRCGGLFWVPLVALFPLACGSDARPEPRAPTPTPRVETPEEEPAEEAPNPEDLPGLDAAQVVGVVSRYQSAVSGCHVIGYSGGAAHSGAVTLSWTINPNGTVREVHVAESSFDDDSFHSCLVTVIEGLEFPEAPGLTEVGAWRFKFRSRGSASGDTGSNTAFAAD